MAQVLIVGAGATGLTLAVDLARRGVGVRVVEKAPKPFGGSRGKGLQPRSLEVFDDLGIIEQLNRVGGPYPPARLYLGRLPLWRTRIARRSAPTDQVPYPNLLMVPQFRTEQLLRDRLAEFGVRVEFGTELVDFEHAPDRSGVRARLRWTGSDGAPWQGGQIEEVAADYLVGADGGRSTVRRALGIGFEGFTREAERMVVADVRLTGVGRDSWHAWIRRGRFALAVAPLAGTDLWQLVLPWPYETDPPLAIDELRRLVTMATGSRVRLTEVTWASGWRANVRLADTYRVGAAFLAGDAAHVHPPSGGQGLNTGVQDAYNLSWKLAAVSGGADPALLDSYQAERRPVAAAALGLSTELFEKAKKSVTKAFRRGSRTTQLGIHYRDSDLSTDQRAESGRRGHDTGLRAGDRMPDGLLTEGRRIFDLLRGPHWTALTASTRIAEQLITDSSAVVPVAERQVRVETVPSHLLPTAIVLVRPDGYIGSTTDDPAAAEAYLRRYAIMCRHRSAG